MEWRKPLQGADLLSQEFIGNNEYQCQYMKNGEELKDSHHVGIYFRVDLSITDLKTTPDGEDSNGAVFMAISDLTAENTSPIAWPMIIKATN